MGHPFVPDQELIKKLKKSNNPVLKALGDNDGLIDPDPKSDLCLDFSQNRVTVYDGKFIGSVEHSHFLRESFSPEDEKSFQDKAIADFFNSTVGFARKAVPENSFDEVKKYWNRNILDLFQKALTTTFSADKSINRSMTMQKKANLVLEDGEWVIRLEISSAVLKEIQPDGEKKETAFPGEIKASFILTNKGFVLKEYTPSTKALETFLNIKPHKPDSEHLAEVNEESEFNRELKDFDNFNSAKEPNEYSALCNSVIDELRKLKASAGKAGSPSFKTLREILTLTVDFHNNYQIDETKKSRYLTLALELGHHPKSKMLAQAMGVLLGVGLIAASITMLVLTLGASIPFCIPGLVAGVGMTGASIFSIVSSRREKPIQKKMRDVLRLFQPKTSDLPDEVEMNNLSSADDKLNAQKQSALGMVTSTKGKLKKHITRLEHHERRLSQK